MNKVILMGRLTKNPDIRYSQAATPVCVARYTLAVDRRFKREGEQTADFINCVAFGKQAEFAEKYLKQGTKIAIGGRIQTGSYEKDGRKVYTTDIVVEDQEFAESKKQADQEPPQERPKAPTNDGFLNIPEGYEKELPFY